ncbi:MAG: hypothetical protein JNL18_03355 [Planctomycetaceae bacterium]|nr:hypothetical protein [Planctomycetaceae bacterium]
MTMRVGMICRGATCRKRRSRWAIACVVGLVAGCSGSNPYDLVDVSGKVSYDDGSLIPAGSIMLKFNPEAPPLDAKTHPRKGFALVNVSDGTFASATTHKNADGLVAGKHKVLVVAYAADGKSANVVPKEYQRPDTTPIEIDTAILPLEIKVQKPTGGK